MDSLDYGRRFIVDAHRPGGTPVTPSDVEGYLNELNDLLEGAHRSAGTVLVEDDDGFSAGILGFETHAVLHLFPGLGTICLQVFTRRDVLLSDLTRELARRFGVGRFESHLGHATKALPKDRDKLHKVLAGDRAYARVRLGENLFSP